MIVPQDSCWKRMLRFRNCSLSVPLGGRLGCRHLTTFLCWGPHLSATSWSQLYPRYSCKAFKSLQWSTCHTIVHFFPVWLALAIGKCFLISNLWLLSFNLCSSLVTLHTTAESPLFSSNLITFLAFPSMLFPDFWWDLLLFPWTWCNSDVSFLTLHADISSHFVELSQGVILLVHCQAGTSLFCSNTGLLFKVWYTAM